MALAVNHKGCGEEQYPPDMRLALLAQAEAAEQRAEDPPVLPQQLARGGKLLKKMEEACARLQAWARARAAAKRANLSGWWPSAATPTKRSWNGWPPSVWVGAVYERATGSGARPAALRLLAAGPDQETAGALGSGVGGGG